jgi:transposase
MTISVPPRKFIATVGAPFADESLLGYVGRALSVTAVRQIATMLRLADAVKPNAAAITTTLVDAREIERVATLRGCAAAEIASRTYAIGTVEHSGSESMDFFGTEIRFRLRECTFRRVSPRALELKPYHRAIWELRPIAFDPQTRERLLDTCPICNRKLGWLRADLAVFCDKCEEIVDLRDFPQAVSPVDDEEAYGFVIGLVDPDPAKKEAARRLLPGEWSGFSNGALFETTIALACGLLIDPTSSSVERGRGREQFEALTPDLLALAGRAIIDGEAGFSALCNRYRVDMEKRPNHYGRRKELGPLARITDDKHIEPAIRDLLSGLIGANLRTTRREYALRKGSDADGSMPTIEWLAKTFNVRREILQRLSRSGFIPVSRAQKVRSPVRMAVRDVQPLLVQLADAISEKAAAGLLGLPVSVLPSLADRGLIRKLEGPVRGLLPGYSGYDRPSVEGLMEKIWSAARPIRDRCHSIAVAARSICTGEAPWAAIISAIISGNVEVFDTGAQSRNIRFSLAVKDVASFVAGVSGDLQVTPSNSNPSEWVAQSTAAEILQVNVAFLSRLAHARPDLLSHRGPGYTPYAAIEVHALARAYIFVPEIASRSEMHPRRATTWLRSKAIRPQIALQENRDFGYQRLAVEPLLAEIVGETAKRKAALEGAGDSVRIRLIARVAAGGSIRAAAEAVGVPRAKARQWVEIWRDTGAVTTRKFGRRSKLDKHEDFLRQLVAERPTIRLAEMHTALAGRGVKACKAAVWNGLQRFGIELADRDARRAASFMAPGDHTLKPRSERRQSYAAPIFPDVNQ